MKKESPSIDLEPKPSLKPKPKPTPPPPPPFWRKAALGALRCFAGVFTGVALVWAVGAIYFDGPLGAAGARGNIALALFWLLVLFAALWLAAPRGWLAMMLVMLGLWLVVLLPWLSLRPTGDRDWPAPWSRTASAEIDGDLVTLHQVRRFHYKEGGTTDEEIAAAATPHWETRQVHLSRLRGIDLFCSYWGSPFIAHTIVSFDFGADGRIAFSIETRADRSQSYNPIAGLYRQYELIYVVADERDVIALRTNYRKGEEVYLYRLDIGPEAARARFREYLEKVNALHAAPEFYNVITANCTTSIRAQIVAADRLPLTWRLLLNGTMDAWLYHSGALVAEGLPFPELKERVHINARAKAAGEAADFSERIREGVPGQ